jgi:hypothetical protein
VQAGEVSLAEATRELRAQGKLPPAKPPKLGGAAKRPAAETGDAQAPVPNDELARGAAQVAAAKPGDAAEATAPPPAGQAANDRPGAGMPVESGAALADALVAAMGIGRALALLREAVAAVEARLGQPNAGAGTGEDGDHFAEPALTCEAEDAGGEAEAATLGEPAVADPR